jgi:hypothetical protein
MTRLEKRLHQWDMLQGIQKTPRQRQNESGPCFSSSWRHTVRLERGRQQGCGTLIKPRTHLELKSDFFLARMMLQCCGSITIFYGSGSDFIFNFGFGTGLFVKHDFFLNLTSNFSLSRKVRILFEKLP